MGQQSMPAASVHHPTSPEETTGAPGDLPRFIQFLAREARSLTNDPANPVEQGICREPGNVVRRQPVRRRMREAGVCHGAWSVGVAARALELIGVIGKQDVEAGE